MCCLSTLPASTLTHSDHVPATAQHTRHRPCVQVIQNACATQAIVSVLMNRPELEIGAELTQLRDFTRGFPPEMKGGWVGGWVGGVWGCREWLEMGGLGCTSLI